MHVLAHTRIIGKQLGQRHRKIVGIARGEAQSLQARQICHLPQQLHKRAGVGRRKTASRNQIKAIRINILSEQHNFFRAAGDQQSALRQNLLRPARNFPPTGKGNNAKGAEVIAALDDVDETCDFIFAGQRRRSHLWAAMNVGIVIMIMMLAGLFCARLIEANGHRWTGFLFQQRRKVSNFSRSNNDVNLGGRLKKLGAFGLGHTSGHNNLHAGPLFF